jgi:hypothetical protein
MRVIRSNEMIPRPRAKQLCSALMKNVGFFVMAILTVAPPRGMREFDDPINPLDMRRTEAPGDVWIKHKMEITALRVRLNGLGARTHSNWVLFRLPFDVRQEDRIRKIDFEIVSKAPSDVAAMMIGSVCMEVAKYGDGIRDWSSYTQNGVSWTDPFGWAPAAPTNDPTILGLNVPTRVANYAACGWDDGHLRDEENWVLNIEWEER